LTAALAFALAADGGDFGPWAVWSSTALPASTVVLSQGDGPARSIAIGARSSRDVTAHTGDRSIDVTFANLDAQTGHARYRIAGGPWRGLAFARTASHTFLSLEGSTFAFTDRGAQASASVASGATAGDGFLRAPMSGRVVTVSATSGDVAKAGTALVVLEAMKMEHALTLPIDARFGDVTAVAGMQVHANDILLAYEPAAV
jgi:acetyl/propionyl-CoA carboxylase alpha subunit